VLYLAPGVALYSLFVLWPLLRVLWLSLFRWDGYGPQVFNGLANFADLRTDPVFLTAASHSLWWEIAAAVIPTGLALCFALLARTSRLAPPFLATIFFPALLPATITAAITVLVYSPASGLLDSILRAVGLGGLARGWLGDPNLALPALFVAWMWSSLGIGTLFVWTGLRAIGREYVELALVDGAGAFRRFWHVLLPGVRWVLLMLVILNAALAAQVFDLVFVTTGGGPGYSTLLLPIDMYGRAFGGYTGRGAAAATVLAAFGGVLAAGALVLVRSGRRAADESMAGDTLDGGTARLRPAVSIAVVLVGAAVLLPLAWLAVVALGGVQLQPGVAAAGLDPRTWSWGTFGSAWDAGMAGAFETSILLALGVVVVTLCAAVPAAFALARLVKANVWRAGILAVLVVGLFQPTPVVIISLFWLLKDLNMLDTVWGVVLPEVARAIPFAVLVLWAFFTALPANVLEAAEVDGAHAWQQLVRVVLPLSRPALVVVMIWAFVGSWSEYLLPTIVSQDGSLQTVPTLLATFVGRSDTEYGLLAAGSILATLPALVLYIVFRRSAALAMGRVGSRQR
jgi:ABC-type sugar transport system permease subunit